MQSHRSFEEGDRGRFDTERRGGGRNVIGGTNWKDAVTSQGKLAATRSSKKQGPGSP